jgi:hypothetical protein
MGNKQGILPKGYPEYAPYPGVGGKFYRQGLIKFNEFVTHCARDRVPIIWFQDTTGIDVGDIAEKAELLGLGQSLIYSIEQSNLPMMCVILRKGTAAAHYIMGGLRHQQQHFHPGNPYQRDLCDARGDGRSCVLRPKAGEGEGFEPVLEAGHRQNERPGAGLLQQVPPIYCAKTASSMRWFPCRKCGSTWWLCGRRLTRTPGPSVPPPPHASPADQG